MQRNDAKLQTSDVPRGEKAHRKQRRLLLRLDIVKKSTDATTNKGRSKRGYTVCVELPDGSDSDGGARLI